MKSYCLWKKESVPMRQHKEVLWDTGHLLCIYLGRSDLDVFMCKNALSCPLMSCLLFYVWFLLSFKCLFKKIKINNLLIIILLNIREILPGQILNFAQIFWCFFKNLLISTTCNLICLSENYSYVYLSYILY